MTILSVNGSEGLDTDFLFFEDKADIFGTVTIDGEAFGLPLIDGSDAPHWDGTSGRFAKVVSGDRVSIRIESKDDDGAISGDTDSVDINPDPAKTVLDFEFSLCSLRVTGDVTGPSQGVLVSTGDASDRGTIRFKVELGDGRPNTSADVALLEADLIQVVHQTRSLIARKPAVLMMRVANNFAFAVSTSVRVQMFGPRGFFVDDTFPIEPPLGAGEVRKLYFYDDAPLQIPLPTDDSREIALTAEIDPRHVLVVNLPPEDCRRVNDSIAASPKDGLRWKVVETKDLKLLWSRVGTLLDVGAFAPEEEYRTITAQGTEFILATYPMASTTTVEAALPIIPPGTAALDFLFAIASIIGVPADALSPFILVHELNGAAAVTGTDRLMGMLRNGWFDRFSYDLWSGVTGLSLGDVSPRAVIFLPTLDGVPGEAHGPAMMLPAHELGHTFGLSVDPRLQDVVFCGIDDPISRLACFAWNCFDEYTHEDEAYRRGNPARGFWVRQTAEMPVELEPLLGEQCDSHCFMGFAAQNAHLDWARRRKWIDAADYDELVEKLRIGADPEVLYVSGMIDYKDRVFLGPWYRLPQGVPDRAPGSPGHYGFRFIDKRGSLLQEVGIPMYWSSTDAGVRLPVTFFGQLLPFAKGTERIEIWNRETGTLLAKRKVSPHPPDVEITSPKSRAVQRGIPVSIRWSASDADQDSLEFSLLLSSDRKTWAPVAYRLTDRRFELETRDLRPGKYLLKVLAADGVNVRESQPISISVREKGGFTPFVLR